MIISGETTPIGAHSLEVARTVDPYGRVTSAARDGVEDSILYNPTNETIAAISNSEAYVTYAYTSDLKDAGYTLALAYGATFARETYRGNLHFRDQVYAVTNYSPAATNAFGYSYDDLSRPVSRNSDAFAYNRRGEVTNAVVSGTASRYGYDPSGNHVLHDCAGLVNDYAANDLNQLVSHNVYMAGSERFFYDVCGSLVHSVPYLPDDPYDEWNYTYDAKSRLTSAWRRACGATNFEFVVSNVYDHLDRRVQKITPGATHTYFYDGWLLVKEIVANVDESRSVIEYHWGKDLSGTIGGAGGVGGLLYLTISNSTTPNSSTRQLYVPWYDAYGNVMGYWDAQGHVVAEYTYDAFGKLIASSGPMANVFSLRYSTKYFDPETGFYYYGYRFYSPFLKRWLTRDPIGEEGGVKVTGMILTEQPVRVLMHGRKVRRNENFACAYWRGDYCRRRMR